MFVLLYVFILPFGLTAHAGDIEFKNVLITAYSAREKGKPSCDNANGKAIGGPNTPAWGSDKPLDHAFGGGGWVMGAVPQDADSKIKDGLGGGNCWLEIKSEQHPEFNGVQVRARDHIGTPEKPGRGAIGQIDISHKCDDNFKKHNASKFEATVIAHCEAGTRGGDGKQIERKK